MGRIGIDEADKYVQQSNSKTNYFSLKNDRDTARVRFMYNDVNDMSLNVVHRIEVNGKNRWVNCLRSCNDPADVCPLCKAGHKQMVKMFIPVYNIEKDEVQIWERGRNFVPQLSSMAARYAPLCGEVIEIERQGRAGEQTTKYQMYPIEATGTKLTDLPEVPNVMGGLVMDKSYDELSKYVQTGSFDEGHPRERREATEYASIPTRERNY